MGLFGGFCVCLVFLIFDSFAVQVTFSDILHGYNSAAGKLKYFKAHLFKLG